MAAAERRSLTNFLHNVIQDRVDGGLEGGAHYSYTRKKLWEALGSLVGDGAMAARLGYPYMHLLILQPDKDLPASLRAKFRSLMADLERHAVDSRTDPTRINMRHPKSDRAAQTILDLYVELKGGI